MELSPTAASRYLRAHPLQKPVKVWPQTYVVLNMFLKHVQLKVDRKQSVSCELQRKKKKSAMKLVEVTPFPGLSDEDSIFISTFCPVPSYVVLRSPYLLSTLMFVQPDITHQLLSNAAVLNLASPAKQAKKMDIQVSNWRSPPGTRYLYLCVLCNCILQCERY